MQSIYVAALKRYAKVFYVCTKIMGEQKSITTYILHMSGVYQILRKDCILKYIYSEQRGRLNFRSLGAGRTLLEDTPHQLSNPKCFFKKNNLLQPAYLKTNPTQQGW